MTNQEDYNTEVKELESNINSCNIAFMDIEAFTEFVIDGLTKHLYNVMNDEKSKPSFNDWENLQVNTNTLVEMLHRIGILNEYKNQK